MTLIYGIWLTDLIDMIGQSISTIAFDTDLIIKIYTIILYCILYMIREWNIAFYRDNSRLLQIKNTEQYYIYNSKTYASNAINISTCIQ